ncbi:hypothetical protein KFL_000280410 [Klebsormidium nitens]|uniref:Tubby C-terminal domain-containing protein n=1 Tax=Klebsormidium nitens TaxID=105231 RepID=A0A1Y1HRY3_KLENI|nr:hypothetical protein KFL_000280410 [Klebsormidium nitens]|eukprot:GAQ79336.1 hypothetical protein KFL_000280410 [Klebsormidium nitens]
MEQASFRSGGSEADELDIRGDHWGAGLGSQKGSRKAAPVRPVSARSYENAAAAERGSPARGSKLGGGFGQMAPNKGVDFLTGSVTQYNNHLFDDSEGDDSPARTPSSGYVLRPPTASLQQSVAALKRKERSLSGGLAVANDSLSRTMRPGSAAGSRPLSPRSPIGEPALSSFAERRDSPPPSVPSEEGDEPYVPNLRQLDPGPRASPKKQRSDSLSPAAQEVEKELNDYGIESVYEPISPTVGIASTPSGAVDLSDVRAFLMQPGPRDKPVQCHIRREKGKKSGHPVFVLCLTEGDRFLLCAKNEPKAKTSNYVISLDRDDFNQSSANYFGKLRANFMGTEFWFYDKGADCYSQNPSSISVPSSQAEREMLGCVTYQYNVMGTRGPRKMTGVIPKLDANEHRCTFDANGKRKDQAILEKFRKKEESEKMVIMRNKPPKWNEQLGAYCLNFNGRVTHASVKNFQLVTDSDKETIILQFGKAGNDFFTMDYQYPMSALQGLKGIKIGLDEGSKVATAKTPWELEAQEAYLHSVP